MPLNIFITGISRGLGEEIAEHYLDEGNNILGFSRGELRTGSPLIKYLDKNLVYKRGSILNEKDIDDAIELFKVSFGGVDVLINNSGSKVHKLPNELTSDEYKEIINTNLTYQIILTKKIASIMAEQRSGKIINIASRAGMEYYEKGTAYCSSKAGLIAYTVSLAESLKKYNVSVNVLSPPTISTRDYRSEKPGLDHSRFLKTGSIIKTLDYFIYSNKFVTGRNIPFYSYKSFAKAILQDLKKFIFYFTTLKFR